MRIGSLFANSFGTWSREGYQQYLELTLLSDRCKPATSTVLSSPGNRECTVPTQKERCAAARETTFKLGVVFDQSSSTHSSCLCTAVVLRTLERRQPKPHWWGTVHIRCHT